MQTTVKVVKWFGVDKGANIIALYLRTDQPEESFNHLYGQAISIKPLEGTEETMGKATKDQMQEAYDMLKNGAKVSDIVAATGVSESAAYKLQRQLREPNKLPNTSAKVEMPEVKPAKPERAVNQPPPFNQIKSSLMTEADIKKYGLPNKADLSNVPKEFCLKIGPVGISLVDKVVAETLEPLKAIGITDVYITVMAGGNNVQSS